MLSPQPFKPSPLMAPSLHPDPSKSLLVIGAGMSRTGTMSLAYALSILLDGPSYHAGSALWQDERHAKRWITVFRHAPTRSPADEAVVKDGLGWLHSGHVACMDAPSIWFVGELIDLYPSATVIATTRDIDAWWRSMEPVMRQYRVRALGFIFYLLPALRHWTSFIRASGPRFAELYLRDGSTTVTKEWYTRHMEYVARTCEEKGKKLHLVSIQDGWEPLCQILSMDVPRDEKGDVVPFPRINDGAAIEALYAMQIKRGLTAWAMLFGAVAAVAAVVAVMVGLGWAWRIGRNSSHLVT